MFYNNADIFKMGEFELSPITMLTASTDLTFTATVVVAGIVIVVGMLLLLIGIFYAFGAIVSNAEKAAKKRAMKKKEKHSADKAEIPKAPAVKPPVVSNQPKAPVVQEGISGEVVAAISAAVAISQGPDAVIKSIKRKEVGGRNPWANAAVIDNTRPF